MLLMAAMIFIVSAAGQAGQRQEMERLSQLLDASPEEVIARLQSMVRENPSVPVHFLMARAWARIDADQSLPWLEKVFATSPDHEQAWQLWADIMVAGGQLDYAMLRIEQQLKRNSEFAYLHLILAQFRVNIGSFATARQAFQQAVDVAPETSPVKTRALYSLGFLHLSLGEIEDGQHLLRQVLNRDRSYYPAITALSKLLLDTGRNEEAGQLLARVREMKSTDPEVGLLLGRYHLGQSESKEAVAVLEEVLAMDPDYALAHFFLAQAYQAEGNVDVAKQHFGIFRESKKQRTANKNADRLRGLSIRGAR